MKQQDYGRLGLFIDTVYQVQITSLAAMTNGGQIRVDLLNEGLGGWTPGSGDETIDIGYALPIGGLEFDFKSADARGSYHDVQIPVGSKWYKGRGKFLTGGISGSANASTEGTAQFVGPLQELQ